MNETRIIANTVISAVEAESIARAISERAVSPHPECLIWTGATDRGYGRIAVKRRAKRVHRVAWELEFGPIPVRMTIDHICGITMCCNTDHMELVSSEENSSRAAAARREAVECRNGHAYTDENTGYRSSGQRFCRICWRASKDRDLAKLREQRRKAAA